MTDTNRTDLAAEVREFLSTRRARITPEQAGLPVYGGNRRVTGLRREEVALLAGVSVDYYIRLERGNLSGASDSVLDALAHALQLNEAERTHLYDLARASHPSSRRRTVTASRVRPTFLRLLDSMTDVPAYVRNARLRHPRRQHARPGAVRARLRLPAVRPARARQHRPLPLPGPCGPGLLDRLGQGCRRLRRLPAVRDGPGAPGQGADRPGRGAHHQERGLRPPVGPP